MYRVKGYMQMIHQGVFSLFSVSSFGRSDDSLLTFRVLFQRVVLTEPIL